MIQMLVLFILLLASHAICDYPLQGDFLSRAKCGNVPNFPWQWALFWHAFMHGVGVMLVTGNLLLGLLEFVAHAGIDYQRARKERFDITVDQSLHILTKVVIVFVRAKGWA